LIVTSLGSVGQFEQELILIRANEGRAKAKSDGVVFGWPPKLTAHHRREENSSVIAFLCSLSSSAGSVEVASSRNNTVAC